MSLRGSSNFLSYVLRIPSSSVQSVGFASTISLIHSSHAGVLAASGYDWRNISRSALMVSASVVGMPCGKPG